ncbi:MULTISPECIES: DUF504 domain-containing protein [Metallosphaera]|uniref:UPF0248 protein Msed_0897 n=3 Tax=Metallosphaera TaxID=41980 RepID=Y897_METS5|nr:MULTISPECIES: DUF504 domain-containing protein [Metallosphaera]A4YF67.1 RecName: Full=UPF0248 protein Msed_0897 [Metallosphaera sedula DSM 5348]ABP95069.1 protein of unknown function DUF504 [Metallosphaera sedula DSM 5348]AIM27055.1 protein of unknown function DUF504 [Metallosphaera sedula]AKV73971.1 hypothetical protein MsedA_0913 [Metallosphaera sedula]AKV76210.1 hypothetical protein MsedB_0914 [Metallosphaera sedula]AKV78463.1 hypothetical protein MsedC_0913 [Metallosphaera sedula]
MTIKDELNRILWTRRDLENYSVLIVDRFKGLVEIPFPRIERVDNTYIYLDDDTVIPIHRVMEIRMKGQVIWSRTANRR